MKQQDQASRPPPPTDEGDFDRASLETLTLGAAHGTLASLEARAPSELRPLTVDALGLSRLLGVSLRTIRKLSASAKLPRPIALGRRRLWSIQEIESWVAAGAPGRERWESLKKRR